nr:hypothetical protein CFP56_47362 [Quercus suber]
MCKDSHTRASPKSHQNTRRHSCLSLSSDLRSFHPSSIQSLIHAFEYCKKHVEADDLLYTACLLKPAFTIIRDKDSKCFLLLICGYAHCGMVAAARWIAKLSTPFLLKALDKYPDYKVKIVGHSLGGGTAALLTLIL